MRLPTVSKQLPGPAEIAAWMVEQVETKGDLFQIDAYLYIEEVNPAFALVTDRGAQAISPKVLSAFRKLTKETVVWERSDKYWRKRTKYDAAGRLQY